MLWFRQYYLGCLSHASYLVGDTSTGRAVVVDPQRDIAQYLADADANGLRIERVIETHFHADFLSGHLELAEATGAAISYGEAAAGRAEYAIDTLAHGERISLGEVELEVRATPGHTPESISLVVHPAPGEPPARPFDITEYERAAEQVTLAAAEARALLADVRALGGDGERDAGFGRLGEAVGRVEGGGRALVNLAAWRALELMLAAFALAFTYRRIEARLARGREGRGAGRERGFR